LPLEIFLLTEGAIAVACLSFEEELRIDVEAIAEL